MMCVSMMKEWVSVQISLCLASVGRLIVLEKTRHNVFLMKQILDWLLFLLTPTSKQSVQQSGLYVAIL